MLHFVTNENTSTCSCLCWVTKCPTAVPNDGRVENMNPEKEMELEMESELEPEWHVRVHV